MSHPFSGEKEILELRTLIEPLFWDLNDIDRAMIGEDLIERLEDLFASRIFYERLQKAMKKLKATFPISAAISPYIKGEKKKLEHFMMSTRETSSKIGAKNFNYEKECHYFHSSKVMGDKYIKGIMTSTGNALEKASYLV